LRRLTGSAVSIGLGIVAIGLLIDLIGRSGAPIAHAQPDRPVVATPINRLVNPDLEDGYYVPDPTRNSIHVPNGWRFRWYEDMSPSGYAFMQPETNILDPVWPDCCADNYPPRIHSGQHAFESGKQWAPEDVTLYQSVGNVPIGAVVTASAWVHAWVTSCNPNPKNKPPEMALSLLSPNADDATNCAPGYWPIESNHMLVGIDPGGGTDPRAASVVWNWDASNPPWWGPYDYYSSTMPALAVAQAHTVTMFIRAVTISPARYNAIYMDDASLEYSYPISASAQVEGLWPLPITATLSVQSPVSLTQVTVSVDSGEPIEWVDTISVNAASLARWRFAPVWPGTHILTLNAAELVAPIVQTMNVPIIPTDVQQDQLLPQGEVTGTAPVWITLTLHSPITLSEPTATLTDPLGLPLSITLNYSEFLDPIVNYHWSFTTAITGWHTVSLSTTEFTQPLTRSILAANARVYLPVSARNFSAP
jgi:hypothetical protein